MIEEKTDEIVIDNSNFHEYFFDIRKNGPQAGQVMAKFSAVAVFADGPEKRDVIDLLKIDKAFQATMVMNKIHCARLIDSYRVCREICEDLISGMTDDEVAAKEYEFVIESMFYTKKEYVPKRDPHWELLTTLQFDPETNTFKSNIEI